MEPALFSHFVTCYGDLLSEDCRFFIQQITNLATVLGAAGALAIPFVIWRVSHRATKRRATNEMLVTLMTASEVIDRLERLFMRRKHDEEGGETPDPYNGDNNKQVFELITVLNHFESICYQIRNGDVIEDLLFEATKDTLIGVKNIILKRYSDLTGIDQTRHHPNLVSIGDRWEARAKSGRIPIQEKIPNLLH